jgi:hypothetical protein
LGAIPAAGLIAIALLVADCGAAGDAPRTETTPAEKTKAKTTKAKAAHADTTSPGTTPVDTTPTDLTQADKTAATTNPGQTTTADHVAGGRDCPLTQPGSGVPMSMPGCQLLASDTASNPNPIPFWGLVACQNSSRAQQLTRGGDPHLTATGAPQGDGAYRRLTVIDGDNPSGWGERCELGRNNHRTGPTAFYHEGERRATYLSLRLPSNLDRGVNTWQDVMQMKQAQPSDNGGGVPILYFAVHNGQWRIESVNREYGLFGARSGVWTRFAFDVYYSQDPRKGWLQVSADLNGDGDFNDHGERTPVIHAATLIAETDGPMGTSDGLGPGDSIPSHLRAGIYHNSSIPCPAPVGCSVELDNVQVLKSPSGP